MDLNLPITKKPNGSGYIQKRGYKVICKKEYIGYPHADKKGRIFGHTYIMCEHLGRPLKKGESVHHKNGIKDDNRLENLELWHVGQRPGQRVEDKIKWAKEYLIEYGYKIEDTTQQGN